MKKKIASLFNTKTIPLLALSVLFSITIVQLLTDSFMVEGKSYSYQFNEKHYLALGALIINYATYVFSFKHYKYTLLVTLLLGLFNIINFNIERDSFFWGSDRFIQFQPYIFLICLLTYAFNYKSINALLGTFISPTKHIKDKRQKEYLMEKSNRLKKMYTGFETVKLEKIIADQRYQKEAQLAAKEILAERNIVGRKLTNIFETEQSELQEGIPGPAVFFQIVIELDNQELFELGVHQISKWKQSNKLFKYKNSPWEKENNFNFLNLKIAKVLHRNPEENHEGSLTIILENNVMIEHQCGNGDQLFIDKYSDDYYE